MAGKDKTFIRQLPTGVPGLDAVVGGGLPEFSFNVIAGAPGSGKTTLAHQMMFTNASRERPALYFTILGEPPLKMLRYQQQFDFFDPERVGETIHFVNLAHEVQEQNLDVVLKRIIEEVERISPGIVVVDSFRSIVRNGADSDLPAFVQRLSLHLATWEATTFLVGEYDDEDLRSNPVFTVADGIIWLNLSVERNSVVRKLQVRKLRGQKELPGLHNYRISEEGLRVFARRSVGNTGSWPVQEPKRLSTGVAGLDEMTHGGIPEGDVVLIAGPPGSGKSVLADQFIITGGRAGEPGVVALFDERPRQVINRGEQLNFGMDELIDQGLLRFVHIRPQDLSAGEMLYEIQQAIEEIGAKRVALDSLAGFEVALAPTFREEFREGLYHLVESLVGQGITVMPTVEVVEAYNEFRISPQHPVSFAVDDIILQRYVEVNGALRKVMAVVKMRNSSHSKEFRAYEITSEGLVLGEPMYQFHGLLHGVPTHERKLL